MRLRHWLILALTLALAAGGLMTLHTVRHILRARRATGALRPWMSIPYIARSHHVPVEDLYQAVGLPVDHRDHRPIGRIARQQGRPVRELIGTLESAIARARTQDAPRTHGASP